MSSKRCAFFLFLFHLVFLNSVALFAGREFPAMSGEQVAAGEILVKLKHGGNIAAVIAALGGNASATSLDPAHNLHLIKVDPSVLAAAAALLRAHPLVEYFEPNRLRSIAVSTPSDPSYGSQWALTTVHALQAWSLIPDVYLTSATPESGRLKIAILDTGIDCTHPDFKNSGGSSTDSAAGGQLSFALSQALVATKVASPACPWQDDQGHGTHTAGTIAAATQNLTGIAGLAYPVEVISYKVLDNTGSGYDSDIASAMRQATDAGARVISISLGGAGYSQTLQDSVRYAWQHNTIVVAAAGNNNSNQLFFPAGANYAVGVAATDSANNKASFSNYGTAVDIAAPGVSILSTLPTYTNSFGTNYGNLSGTSMATPHVSAVAGLVTLANRNAPGAAVVQRLQQSASSSDSTGGWNQYSGYGILDAFAAVSGATRNSTVGGLVGQVVDASGTPVNLATVTVNGQSATTASDGLFRFSNLAAGTYPVMASASGFSMLSITATIAPGADTSLELPMGVALGEFSGTVTGGTAGVIVQALSGNVITATAVAGNNGAYALWVPAGTYDVRAGSLASSGTIAAGQTVAAGGDTIVNLSLSNLGLVSGTVKDGAGNPISGAQVAFNGPITAGAITDVNGQYTTIGLPSGAYTATASASGVGTSASYPVTVSADTTVNASFQIYVGISSVSLTPATVAGGGTSKGTVNLSGPAPGGGLTVSLTSSDSAAAVPATIVVPQGAASATFTVSTTSVSAARMATISASANNTSASAALTISAAALSSLSLSPNATPGGTNTTANTVVINSPAPAGGAAVTLSSSNPSAVVPASVTVAAGATSAKFTITTGNVSAATAVTISAAFGGIVKTAVLTVNPVALSALSLSPSSTAGGNTTTGNSVSLNAPAPAGGISVTLTSASASASVPATVVIPAGTTSAKFSIITSAVSASTAIAISASYSGVTKTANLTLLPVAVSNLTLSPSSTAGGNQTTSNTIYLNGPAPAGGAAVALSSSDPSATVPATLTVAAGATTAKFTIVTAAVATSTPVTISASYGGVTKSATLTVSPVALSSISLYPATVAGGNTSTGNNVYLNGPAPAGGIIVTLASADASATVAASVTVPAGATSAKFSITTAAVPASKSVAISAAYSGVTKTANLTITPVAVSGLTLSPNSTKGGTTTIYNTVTLNAPAPAGGAVITLSSSNASASVPTNITLAAGATSGKFTIVTTAVTASTPVTISAAYGPVTKTAVITVTP